MILLNLLFHSLEKQKKLYNQISTIDTKLKKLYSELEQDEKELAELKKTLTNETHSLVKAQNDLKTYRAFQRGVSPTKYGKLKTRGCV